MPTLYVSLAVKSVDCVVLPFDYQDTSAVSGCKVLCHPAISAAALLESTMFQPQRGLYFPFILRCIVRYLCTIWCISLRHAARPARLLQAYKGLMTRSQCVICSGPGSLVDSTLYAHRATCLLIDTHSHRLSLPDIYHCTCA